MVNGMRSLAARVLGLANRFLACGWSEITFLTHFRCSRVSRSVIMITDNVILSFYESNCCVRTASSGSLAS